MIIVHCMVRLRLHLAHQGVRGTDASPPVSALMLAGGGGWGTEPGDAEWPGYPFAKISVKSTVERLSVKSTVERLSVSSESGTLKSAVY